jgi:hypothetical protein
VGGRRGAGTNLRAVGANPRAETHQADLARRTTEAEQRVADLEAEAAARRAADLAARAEAERVEAEALAVSAALDRDRLAAVVDLVADSLAGPLARSPLAVSRAVLVWCRAAAVAHPGPLTAAVDAALRTGAPSAGEDAAPLELPAPPAGTAPLRDRIAPLLHHDENVALTHVP